jgi:hypothetical protein
MEGAVDVAKVAAFVTVVALAFFAFPAVGVCVGLTVATAATVALIAKCCLVAFTILVLLKLLACCLAGGYSHDKDSVAESGSSQSSAHGKGPFRDPEFSHTEQSRSESSPVS